MLHIPPGIVNKFNTIGLKELLSQHSTDIAPLSKNLSKQRFEQIWDWFAIIGVTRRQGDIEQLSRLIEH